MTSTMLLHKQTEGNWLNLVRWLTTRSYTLTEISHHSNYGQNKRHLIKSCLVHLLNAPGVVF